MAKEAAEDDLESSSEQIKRDLPRTHVDTIRPDAQLSEHIYNILITISYLNEEIRFC